MTNAEIAMTKEIQKNNEDKATADLPWLFFKGK
jgi:hypothetical protein